MAVKGCLTFLHDLLSLQARPRRYNAVLCLKLLCSSQEACWDMVGLLILTASHTSYDVAVDP